MYNMIVSLYEKFSQHLIVRAVLVVIGRARQSSKMEKMHRFGLINLF